MPWLSSKKGSLFLLLHVQPGAARARIAGVHGERLKIAVTAPPVEGRANKEVVKFLAGKLGCPSRNIAVVAGLNARQKRIEIKGCEEVYVRAVLIS